MKIAMGNDHGATQYKNEIKDMLISQGHTVIDCGTNDTESVDYTEYGFMVGQKVVDKEADLGIVLCGTGIGISIAANKIKGVRCSLCTNTTMAKLTREHNDSNVLSLGQRIIGIELAKDIVNTYINTPFSKDTRHQRRIDQITEKENQ